MKKFEITISVNDCEYLTTITLYANQVKTTDNKSILLVDGKPMIFDEYVVSVEEIKNG